MTEETLLIVQFAQKDHIFIHTAAPHDGKKHFNCAFCNAMFSRKKHMNDHMKFHIGECEPESRRKIFHAWSFFLKKFVITYSQSHGHKKNKPYACSICEQSF